MNTHKWICGCTYILFGRTKKHRALLTTCERTIAPGGCVLVFYTHHRPHLAHRDMEFFEIAGEMGWECEKVLTERFPVRVCLWLFVRVFFRNSLNKFLILNCHRHRYELAYVSRGLRRGEGAVNGTWLEAHASVTLDSRKFVLFDMEKLR
jgi:hypothetical protein